MEVYFNTIVILWACIFLPVESAPRERTKEQAGPCIGMDCLHGVMMHGDEKQGDDHKAEDTFERLQRKDALAVKTDEEAGPCKGLDCLHEIMHEGEDGVKTMHQKIGPEAKQKDGPEHGMEYMHGVLMHGDKEPGKTHKQEDEPKKVDAHEPDGPCTDCIEGRLHSTHLDRDNTDDETEAPTRHKFDAADPEALLHGGDGTDHAPKQDENQSKKDEAKTEANGPCTNCKEGHCSCNNKDKDGTGTLVRQKFDTADPEALLHGGDGTEHATKQEKSPDDDEKSKFNPKFGTYDLEEVLHGENADNIHKPSESQELENKPVKFETFDPDILLHGGKSHEHDKKPSQDKKPTQDLEQHENTFKKWLKSKLSGEESSGSGEEEDSGGFTFPFISDSLMNEIEYMKQRYIIKPIWGSGEEEEPKDEVVQVETSGDKHLASLKQALMDSSGDTEETDSTSDGVTANVHDRSTRQRVEEDGVKDMTHELEHIGNTKPLRTDVDIMFDKKKKHRHRERDNGL